MEKDERDTLIDNYYKAIILIHDERIIRDNLPIPTYQNFFPIMNALIERLEHEKQLIISSLENSEDEELRDYAEAEIAVLEMKIETCKKIKEEAIEEEKEDEQEEKELEEDAQKVSHKHIIFATTSGGNIYFEEDLKDIPAEFYDKVLECLEDIENNVPEDNTEKGRSFSSINENLCGFKERKRFKIRVLYRHLTPDTAFVVLVKTKKSDFERQDSNQLSNRVKKVRKEFKKLQEAMKDELTKQEIIEKNKKIMERIRQKLTKSEGGKVS